MKALQFGVVVFGLVCLAGCDLEQTLAPASAHADAGVAAQLPPYSGPKASIAVAKFEWKAPITTTTRGAGGLGGFTVTQQQDYLGGLQDMLSTTLVQSGRFKVLERQELAAVRAEQDLGRTGEAEQATAAKTGKIKGADLLVVAAITGFEPGTSGVGGGIGGVGSRFGGALSVSTQKSSIAMDIRLVNSTTTEVVAATRVEGSARDTSIGIGAVGLAGNTPLGGGLSVFAKTPMEKAIRICINEAVKYIVQVTPPEYFKY